MPHSLPEGKDWLAARYTAIRPATVVDIGPGAGTYATLLRPLHSGRWTGVEIHEPYVHRYELTGLYDEVVVGDARQVELPAADLYIAGDVLEHMPREDAVTLVGRMQAAAGHLLVSVPVERYEQGEVDGNPHEAHLYHWAHEEMAAVLEPCASWRGAAIGVYHWQARR